MRNLFTKIIKNKSIFKPDIHRLITIRSFGDFITRARADRLISLILVCIVCVAMVSNLNFALAVSVEGKFVGYVSNVKELEAIVSDVNKTASDALGYKCDLSSELSYKVAVGSAENDADKTIEDKLYSSIDKIDTFALVYADGKPVCAYKTKTEALTALDKLRSNYMNENTLTANFSGDVSVITGYGNKELLECQNELAEGKILTVVTTEKLTAEEPIKYNTEYVYDDSMYADECQTLTQGQDGVMSTDYLLTRVNGELESYTQSDGVVKVKPITAVIKQGTKTRLSTGSYVWPCNGYISSKFGYRGKSIGSSYHTGIDIVGNIGDPVWAADGGTVIFAGSDGSYGKIVEIQHENGDVTYYAHNSKMLVHAGDKVKQGQQIAEMGRTGTASANHCHFELRPKGGSPVNPEKYLPQGVLKTKLCK